MDAVTEETLSDLTHRSVQNLCLTNKVGTVLVKFYDVVRNTVEVDGRTVGVTEFTQGAVALNKLLVVTSNFFRKDTGLVDTSVTILAVTLQEGAGDEVTLFTVGLLSKEFNSFDFLANKFQWNSPRVIQLRLQPLPRQ